MNNQRVESKKEERSFEIKNHNEINDYETSKNNIVNPSVQNKNLKLAETKK